MKKIFLTFLFLLVTACIFILPGCTHTHQYSSKVTPPTCRAQGYTTYTCECGDSYTDNYIDKTEHNYSSTVKVPTCVRGGYTVYSCDTCGDTYRDSHTDKIDHQYSPTVTQPTCTSRGYTAYTCNTCGDNYRENYVDKTEHRYSFVVTQPTCLTVGYTTYTCADCGYICDEDHVDPLDHIWEQTDLINKATGLTYNVCEVCKLMEAELPIININIGDRELTKEYIDTTISVYSCKEEYELYDIEAEVKVRGNSTSVYPKKPLRIKFGKKQMMLGLNNDLKAKSWVLLAEYNDKSFTRNYAALTLAKELFGTDGYYSSDFCYVEVYINSEYNGVYLLCEQQQVNESRVDIYEPEDDYTGLDIGYLIEFDTRAEDEDHYFSIDYRDSLTAQNGEKIPTNYFNELYAVKSDIYSDEQKEYIAKHMQNLYDVIFDAVYNDHTDLEQNPYKTLDANSDIIEDRTIKTAEECIGRLIDIRSLVDTFLLNEAVLNIDIGWSSFYMSVDMSAEGNKLVTFEAPWDFDWGLTCHEHMLNVIYTCNRHDFYTAKENVNPWLVILSNQDWFWDMAKARWAEFRSSGVVERCCLELESYSDIMGINYNDNFILWDEFLPGFNSDIYLACNTQKEASTLVVDYLRERISNLDVIFGYAGN